MFDCMAYLIISDWGGIITMNTISIIILVAIIIFSVSVIIYLLTHKKNGCGYCNGDCKNCQKQYEKIIERVKRKD